MHRVTGLDDGGYVGGHFSPTAVFHPSAQSVRTDVGEAWGALAGSPPSFSSVSPWVVAALCVLFISGLAASIQRGHDRVLGSCALFGIILIPVLAALATEPTPTREHAVRAGGVDRAHEGPAVRRRDPGLAPRPAPRCSPAGGRHCPCWGSPRMPPSRRAGWYARQERPPLDHDRALAYQIEEERVRLVADPALPTPALVSAFGFPAWPRESVDSSSGHGRSVVALGARWRSRSFLISQGVGVTGVTASKAGGSGGRAPPPCRCTPTTAGSPTGTACFSSALSSEIEVCRPGFQSVTSTG